MSKSVMGEQLESNGHDWAMVIAVFTLRFIVQVWVCNCKVDCEEGHPETLANNQKHKILKQFNDALNAFSPQCFQKW